MEQTHENTRIRTRIYTNLLRLFVLFSVSLFLFVFFRVGAASAATLYFSPSSESYTVGSAFSVSVYVSSADQAMNAASGVISFPQDKLEVTSFSKSGSIFTLWVQEPLFSNTAGTINFEGIVLNPGFTGAAGKIIAANFRVKAAGFATLNFSSGSVLANDGKGTNILISLGNAQFSLGGAAPTIPEAITPSIIFGAPSAPQISSPTHPDPNKWYAKKDAKFTWTVPFDATGVRLLVSKIPAVIPTVTYVPAISGKEITDLTDGIWYFHVQLRNANGWGEISHFRFQIDTEKPERFEIEEIKREDLTDPRAKFVFDASDKTSGIDHYEVQIDSREAQAWKDDGSGVYETPILGPGKHLLIAKAVDKANNFLANSAEFIIEALKPPKIIDYPEKLESGEILVIKGITYSDIQVVIWLQKEGEEPKSQTTRADEKGNFTFIAEKRLVDGVYKVWAEAINEKGARSDPSEKITFVVRPPAFLRFGRIALDYLAVLITLIILLLGILMIIFYSWRRISLWRKKIRKETKEAKESVPSAFNILKREIEEQIAKLDGEPGLSEREKEICDELKEALKTSEEAIGKEIEEIEKELE